MADYSKKALTREEALKLKALGESYDITPMSIKEAIIAGASSEDGEDFLVQALTNDERLDYYRNSNSGDDGDSSDSDGGYSEAKVTLMLSDQLIESMTQHNIDSLPINIMGPFVVHDPAEGETITTEYSSPIATSSFGLENTPFNVTAVYPTGGECWISLYNQNNSPSLCFTDESSGNIVNLNETEVAINGDCILIVSIIEHDDPPLS